MSGRGSEPVRRERLRAVVRGAVQGVGFRPYVHHLATSLGLAGWVQNTGDGLWLEVEGPGAELREFLTRLPSEIPAHAFIQSLEPLFLDVRGYQGFEIRESSGGTKSALILPDIATCPDCLSEILNPSNRRYRYPFTNCTHCGPRYSVIENLPYDRPNTTMKDFPMCPDCQWEYHNPQDRRFHAQPTACPACGPQLALWDRQGQVIASKNDALQRAAQALGEGLVVAVKGLGGFQLCVDARNEQAVQNLRQRKHRQEKPFALMVPDLKSARALCDLGPLEERLLSSSESPIVLVRRHPTPLRRRDDLAVSVAPQNPYLGLMLPYTPLHHVLMHDFPYPIVATSGNLSEEPICTDEKEALISLGDIADYFLVHNRPIARPVDDSVALVIEDRELLLRRARGYAPLPIPLDLGRRPGLRRGDEDPRSVLAVGGHLKNTIAVARGENVFVSQHIGDLETARAFDTFKNHVQDLTRIYEIAPTQVVCDSHPNYASTHFAEESGLPVTTVQHHFAHVLSCMAENALDAPVLGVAWDGSGYGLDHTLWGGEFLKVTVDGFQRMAHLRTFRLPGGEKAVREPRRSALGLLFELMGEDAFDRLDQVPIQTFSELERGVLRPMLVQRIQSPVASSAGRLFDAVASLLGIRQVMSFEGQAAMELEFAATGASTDSSYPFGLPAGPSQPLVIDWAPMIQAILDDLKRQSPVSQVAGMFHNSLVEVIVAVARQLQEPNVVLTGGCFQNRYLTTRAIRRLRQEGFTPYWHQRVPPNDGGLALGQVMAAVRVPQSAPACV